MITETQISGYYAIYEDSVDAPTRSIVKVGYANGDTIMTKHKIIEPDPTLSALFENEFSSLLTVMYNSGLDIFGKEGNLNFTEKMDRAGRLSDFASIKVLDVMSLLGAVLYDVKPHIRQAGMTQEEIDAIPERPSVFSVLQNPAYEGDDTQFIQAIKYLGLDGWIKYIYAERAISFERFCELWFFFYPELKTRKEKYYEINPFLRSFGVSFGAEHIDTLINAEIHEV